MMRLFRRVRTLSGPLVALSVLAFPRAVAAQAAGHEARSPAAAGDLFTIDDAIDLVGVTDPRMSPDGSRVLFTRRTLDWSDNERDARLWMIRADGTDPRPFTSEEGDGDARWSPDGRWIAFLRSMDRDDPGEDDADGETRQLFLIRSDGGEARQLSHHPTSIQRYAWGPDSRVLYFVAEDSLNRSARDSLQAGYDAVFVDEGPNGQRRGRWSNLWRIDADPDSAAEQPMTTGHRIVGQIAVAPDGRHVAFTVRGEDHRNDAYRSEIALVDVSDGEVRRLTHNQAPESDPAWSADGKTLSWMAPDTATWTLSQGNLYALELATGAVRRLAPDFGGMIGDYAWAPDGMIDFTAQVRTTVELYRLDPNTGRVRRVSRLDGVVDAPSWSRDHGRVAYELSTPAVPGDLYAAAVRSFQPQRLTRSNVGVEQKELASPSVVRWKSSDGREVEGLLYRPPDEADWKAPGPLVLEVHGGPAGSFARAFDAGAQVLAAYGYAVLQPNVRGSSGYGDAWLRGNVHDIGGGDYEDLMTGVDAMVREGVADPDSLAIKGWSYGGILGGWTLTRTTRFKAASLGAMVTDWPAEYGPGFHFDVVRWYLGGDPWSNGAFWRERSSFWHMEKVRTPTLLFHGDRDRTDTPMQSMNFHAALRHFGVPDRFIRMPREPHGFREPHHQRTRMVEELRWFQRWVRGQRRWSPPQRPAADTTARPGADGAEPDGRS